LSSNGSSISYLLDADRDQAKISGYLRRYEQKVGKIRDEAFSRYGADSGFFSNWYFETFLAPDWREFLDDALSENQFVHRPVTLSPFQRVPKKTTDWMDLWNEFRNMGSLPLLAGDSSVQSSQGLVGPADISESQRAAVLRDLMGRSSQDFPVSPRSSRASSGAHSPRSSQRFLRSSDVSSSSSSQVFPFVSDRRTRRGGTFYGVTYDESGFVTGIDLDHYRKLYRKEFGPRVRVWPDWHLRGRYPTFRSVYGDRRYCYFFDGPSKRCYKVRRFRYGWVGRPVHRRDIPRDALDAMGSQIFQNPMPVVEHSHYRYLKSRF
jgi:hypothetical protein